MGFFGRIRNAMGLETGKSAFKPRTPEEFALQEAQKVLNGYDFQWQSGARLKIVEQSTGTFYTGQEFLKKLEKRQEKNRQDADDAPEGEKSQFQKNADLTGRVLRLVMEKIARERKDHP